jgi:hypothetical protein
MTTPFFVLSSSELANACGGAGTGFEPAGTWCAPDTRNMWQRNAPSMLGGKPNPECKEQPARVWFSKDALDGGEVGQRRFTPDAKREISDFAGGL